MRLSEQRQTKFCDKCPVSPATVKRIYIEGQRNFCSSECVMQHRHELQGSVYRRLLQIPRKRSLVPV